MIGGMASLADFLGPILEVMTWVGFVPGVPLLIAGWIINKRRCLWTSTTAEVFEAGRYKGFRWSDSTNDLHLSLHSPAETQALDTGTQIELHYDHCHPSRWRLDPPPHDTTVTILGLILTGVGIACTVAGFVLLMF